MRYYGKEKCRILKQIRAEIAKENDIEWIVEECKHKGNCRGTCPKCEAEVRELEKQLEQRASLGKKVAVAGIAAGIALSISGCAPGSGGNVTPGEPLMPDTYQTGIESTLPTNETDGDTDGASSAEPEKIDSDLDDRLLMGKIAPGSEHETEEETKDECTAEPCGTENETEEEILMGEPVWYPETEEEIEPLMGVPVIEDGAEGNER